jgi:phosphoadenosine phosphosulfate reductase
LKVSHPKLHEHWTTCLKDWAKENHLDNRFIDWGFWRWRRHAPKMVEIAKANSIDLKIGSKDSKDIACQVVRGRSPCGLSFSIEATLSGPQNHPFPVVAAALNMIGEVKYAEELGAAIIKTDMGRITAFANGHIMIIADKEEADVLLQRVCETILRVQMCIGCKICEKNCKQGAIFVKETITIDEKRCNRCGKCATGCIAADQAAKTFRNIAIGTVP